MSNTPQDAEVLKGELQGLFRYIQRVRQEIAAISNPADEDFQFETMSEQLDAIVKATDEATHTIMQAMEESESIIGKVQAAVKDPGSKELLLQLTDNINKVFEACSFQDITGQRIGKVAKSITYVEDRVNALTDVWGREEIAKTEVEKTEKTEDEKLLHGPALDSQRSISQDEIDALFD